MLMMLTLNEREQETYRKIIKNLERVSSQMVVSSEDLELIFVKEGWKLVQKELDKLRSELYPSKNLEE